MGFWRRCGSVDFRYRSTFTFAVQALHSPHWQTYTFSAAHVCTKHHRPLIATVRLAMGVDTSHRPPLPAPTETSNDEQGNFTSDDLATDLSRRTDKTSYTIPEDGSPLTVPAGKVRGLKETRGNNKSQTSLLIEYFEGGKAGDKVHSRPSVRVRVTPSSNRKGREASGQILVTEAHRNSRKPSYTRRISLGSKGRDEIPTQEASEISDLPPSDLSSRGPPVEIEVLGHDSDITRSELSQGRYIPAPSDISSMPPDSMLEGEGPVIHPPPRPRSRSLERHEEVTTTDHSLKAPERRRSRSLSRERITQRVMEKLTSPEAYSKAQTSGRDRTYVEENVEDLKPHKRRSSRTQRDSELVSGTESSLLSASDARRRSGESYSGRSGVSGASSINNPKLLATVEDAIRRLILPELNAVKKEQEIQRKLSTRERGGSSNRDSYETYDTTESRDELGRRISKSSSAPNVKAGKPKVVLNKHGDEPGTTLSGDSVKESRSRRSSRGSTSRHSVEREEEKIRHKRSKDKDGHRTRDLAAAGLVGAGLTAAALKHHDKKDSLEDSPETERRRRKRRSKSRSRTTSLSEGTEETYRKEEIPPLPMQSNLDSDLTRDSIRSAETEHIPSSLASHDMATPVHEVSRGALRDVTSPAPRTPTRTPIALQRGVLTQHSNGSIGQASPASARSDRRISEKARDAALAAAGLGGIALAANHHSHQSPQSTTKENYTDHASDRQVSVSPVQSAASFTVGDDPGYDARLADRSIRSKGSVSPYQHSHPRDPSSRSIDSMNSSPSIRTRKRPKGLSMEGREEILSSDTIKPYHDEMHQNDNADEFFDREHEENERYRHEIDDVSQLDSADPEKHRFTNYTDSSDASYMGKTLTNQHVRAAAQPDYVHTPIAVESAVASLHDPSTISVRSSNGSPTKYSYNGVERSLQDEHDLPADTPILSKGEDELTQHDNASRERWEAIKSKANSLPQHKNEQLSPKQASVRSARSAKSPAPQLGASAIPTADDFMPEIGHYEDSELATNPSEIQGPAAGGQYRRDTGWTGELSPPPTRGNIMHAHNEDDVEHPKGGFGKGALVGGLAGATAAGLAGAAAHHVRHDDEAEGVHARDYQASIGTESEQYAGEEIEPQYDLYKGASPAWKDEGYASAHQPGGITPEPRQKSAKLFDYENTPGALDDDLSVDDPFVGSAKHVRHLSGTSHGMASPIYDSATGKGIDRIQSKDVVALMDHLTVRDAQRNARDTEILVTLVRSAAEMRNSFEEMKKFIAEQDAEIMHNTNKRATATEQKLLQGPRPQPLGSPRTPRQRSTEDVDDVPTKRKNMFRRALKGLSMRSGNDLEKIESMLMTLLDEVEGLKDQGGVARPVQTKNENRSRSFDSYDDMRAGADARYDRDAGYEPEGQAGTSSTPGNSEYHSNPSLKQPNNGMHSGYDGRFGSGHRISTVMEGDEELSEEEARALDEGFENNDRLLTPTQEAMRNRSVDRSIEQPEISPDQPSVRFSDKDQEITPTTPKRKHESKSSSIFSNFPKISRWSKTTTSTQPEQGRHSMDRRESRDSQDRRDSFDQRQRPQSQASRSGSDLGVRMYENDDYEVDDDDRLRSKTSLAHEERGLPRGRSPSPLIPEDPKKSYEDVKYQAHRNSLNLEHPQPRPGNTHRHQNHLETKARDFDMSPSRDSPSFDQWGSNPSLSLNRNRLSASYAANTGYLSPISSDGGYSQHSAAEQTYAPPRPAKVRDDGPLVPPKVNVTQDNNKPYYSSPPMSGGYLGAPLEPIQEVRYSLETDTGRSRQVFCAP